MGPSPHPSPLQDEFAYLSQHKAADAQEAGIFAQEIVPVHTTVSHLVGRRGPTITLTPTQTSGCYQMDGFQPAAKLPAAPFRPAAVCGPQDRCVSPAGRDARRRHSQDDTRGPSSPASSLQGAWHHHCRELFSGKCVLPPRTSRGAGLCRVGCSVAHGTGCNPWSAMGSGPHPLRAPQDLATGKWGVTLKGWPHMTWPLVVA